MSVQECFLLASNDLGSFNHTVFGQYIYTYAFIVLDTQENADRAAKMVTVQYSSQTKPLLTIADAIKANSIYPYPGDVNVLNVGDANGVFI